MFVVASRQNTKGLLVLLNHCLFPSGNGTRSVWTSSPAFQKPRKEMMPSSWSLTDFQKLLTSFQFASPLLLVSWRTCMSLELCLSTVFLRKSILIVVAFSPLDSGEAFKILWELISPLVQLSILSQAVKSKGLTEFSKTCSDLVLSLLKRIGRNLFHFPNLLITTVSNLVCCKAPDVVLTLASR